MGDVPYSVQLPNRKKSSFASRILTVAQNVLIGKDLRCQEIYSRLLATSVQRVESFIIALSYTILVFLHDAM